MKQAQSNFLTILVILGLLMALVAPIGYTLNETSQTENLILDILQK